MNQEPDKETLLNSLGYACLAFFLQGVVLLFPIALTLWWVLLASLVGCGRIEQQVLPKYEPPVTQPLILTNLSDMAQIKHIIWHISTKEHTEILINSVGGLLKTVDEFAVAVDIAKSKGRTIKCTVMGNAFSAAFLIYSMCTERYATKDSRLLFHAPGFSTTDGVRYTLRQMESGVYPKSWSPSYAESRIEYYRLLYAEHLEYLQHVLAIDPTIIKQAYDNDWYLGAGWIAKHDPSFLTLIEENQ